MSLPDHTGTMFEGEPGKRYEFFGFARVGGVTYKFFAWPNRRSDNARWELWFKPHAEQSEPASASEEHPA